MKHLLLSSDLLFRHIELPLCFKICNFSSRQSWHSLAPATRGVDFLRICHSMSGSGTSFISQQCFDRVVEVFSFSWRKLDLCFAILDLNSLADIPS